MLDRVFGSWKTTLGGMGTGGVAAGLVEYVLHESGCDFSNLTIVGIVTFLAGAIQGAVSLDKHAPERTS